MPHQQTISFQDALDAIESLPEYQQEDLIDIIKHRLIENRRDSWAQNIKKAKKELSVTKMVHFLIRHSGESRNSICLGNKSNQLYSILVTLKRI